MVMKILIMIHMSLLILSHLSLLISAESWHMCIKKKIIPANYNAKKFRFENIKV